MADSQNAAQYVSPECVDRILHLPAGRIARMARKGLIPAVILPDGTVRIAEGTIKELLTPRRGQVAFRISAGEVPAVPQGLETPAL